MHADAVVYRAQEAQHVVKRKRAFNRGFVFGWTIAWIAGSIGLLLF